MSCTACTIIDSIIKEFVMVITIVCHSDFRNDKLRTFFVWAAFGLAAGDEENFIL